MGALSRFFKLSESGTNPRREILAGATISATMSCIIVVQPDVMSKAGMDFGAGERKGLCNEGR